MNPPNPTDEQDNTEIVSAKRTTLKDKDIYKCNTSRGFNVHELSFRDVKREQRSKIYLKVDFPSGRWSEDNTTLIDACRREQSKVLYENAYGSGSVQEHLKLLLEVVISMVPTIKHGDIVICDWSRGVILSNEEDENEEDENDDAFVFNEKQSTLLPFKSRKHFPQFPIEFTICDGISVYSIMQQFESSGVIMKLGVPFKKLKWTKVRYGWVTNSKGEYEHHAELEEYVYRAVVKQDDQYIFIYAVNVPSSSLLIWQGEAENYECVDHELVHDDDCVLIDGVLIQPHMWLTLLSDIL